VKTSVEDYHEFAAGKSGRKRVVYMQRYFKHGYRAPHMAWFHVQLLQTIQLLQRVA